MEGFDKDSGQTFMCTFMVPFAECSTPSGNVASAQVCNLGQSEICFVGAIVKALW